MNHNTPFLAFVTILIIINTVSGSPSLYADMPLLSNQGDNNPREEQQNDDAKPIESEPPASSTSHPESQPIESLSERLSSPQEHNVNSDDLSITRYAISLNSAPISDDSDVNCLISKMLDFRFPMA